MTCSNGIRLTAWMSASVLPMARQLVPCCVLSRGISTLVNEYLQRRSSS